MSALIYSEAGIERDSNSVDLAADDLRHLPNGLSRRTGSRPIAEDINNRNYRGGYSGSNQVMLYRGRTG